MSSPLVGQRLGGRYRIDHPIARGGMGAVYEAFDEQLERRVAVKVLLGELTGDPRARERFAREARAVARTSHPSLVTLYDVSLDSEPAYLVLELIDGESLQELLHREGRLPFRRAARLGIGILEGLAALHDVGVVHRDLKPSNVLVLDSGTEHERIKLIDLGVAQLTLRHADARLTSSGVVVGTPLYMSPEQLLGGGAVGPASDLFAVGTLLFEMLTGQSPIVARQLPLLVGEVLTAKTPPLRAIVPEVPAAVASAVERLRSIEPTERPPSARAAATVLSDALGNGGRANDERAHPGSPHAGDPGWSGPVSARSAVTAPVPESPARGPSAATGILRRSHRASVWAARLGAIGVGATCLVGMLLAALYRTPDPTPTPVPVSVPVLPTAAPPGDGPRALTITHSGPNAAEVIRLVAPNLDPRLRACVDITHHGLGRMVAGYMVHLDRFGTPVRLERIVSGGTDAEYACIEEALRGVHFPPPSGEYATATVLLTPTL